MPANPYKDLLLRVAKEHFPLSAMLELTYRCNLDCWFCYNDRAGLKRTLTSEQWIDVLEQSAAVGVLHLTLTGGEPTLHPGFFDILGRARELGFAIRIKSNGHSLSRHVAQRIVDIGDPFMVDVSIHGADAETHERQTQVPGSFDRLLKNLGQAADVGLRVKVVSTLTRWNEDQYEAILEIARRAGFGVRFSTEIAPRDDGGTDTFAVKMSAQAYRRYRDWQLAQSDAEDEADEGVAEMTCGAGGNGFTVSPAGDVLACVQWRASAGNVLETPVQAIWESSDHLRHVREVTQDAVAMLGPGDSACTFCPGTAWVVHQDPMAEYRDQTHPLGHDESKDCGC